MLKDSLYKILSINNIADGISYQISLLRDCPIYAAHFPGMPVTPGVCILQMMEELLADYTHKKVQTTAIKNARFLSMLKPTDEVLDVNIFPVKQEDEKIKVQSTVMDSSGTIYAKIYIICNVV